MSDQSVICLEVLLKDIIVGEKVKDELKLSILNWFHEEPTQFIDFIQLALENNSNYDIKHFPNFLKDQIENINVNFDTQANISIDTIRNSLTLFDREKYKFGDSLGSITFVFYFYQIYNEILQNNLEEDLPATFHTMLPSINYKGLWESLIFDSKIKDKLLNYVRTSLMFANHGVNSSIITWNKVVLLHGPPGTGKTSLCKALCQKLSIILNNQYETIQLIEINSHSLFSKWFSESGKLVLKLFNDIREFVEDGSNLVFVLIDEVESLAYDRQRTNSSDPSDAIRVVNALLTQIDSIRRYPNVIILANSNVTDAMDNAFVDRADIKQYIGLPSVATIYKIFHSCIKELLNSKIIVSEQESPICSYETLTKHKDGASDAQFENSHKLLEIVNNSKNFSGRTLRKLPFLAFALYSGKFDSINLKQYLNFLEMIVQKQMEDNKYFNV